MTWNLWRYRKEVRTWPILKDLRRGAVLRRTFKGETLELIVGDECYFDREGNVYGCLKDYMALHIATVKSAGPRVIRDMSQRPKRFWAEAVMRALVL